MTMNSFGTRDRLTVGDFTYWIHRLDRIEGASRLPYSLKVLLENLARNEDGVLVTAEQVSAVASWDSAAIRGRARSSTPRLGSCYKTSLEFHA
jgi:aconitate hydratase